MTRHPALAQLSRDHHHALRAAMRLKRATDQSAGQVAEHFIEQWERVERRHFRLEEEVLLPAFAAFADPDQPAIRQMLIDHTVIRAGVLQLEGGAPLQLLQRLGARLDEHVRLEERQVFPLIEAAMPEPALRQLGERLGEAGAHRS